MIKVYTFLEGMSIDKFPETELIKIMQNHPRFDVELSEITPITDNSNKPWIKSLNSMDIGNHNIVTKKDVALLTKFDEYKMVMDDYEGVFVCDFNKEVKDIDEFIKVLDTALEEDRILTTKPIRDKDINKDTLFRSKKNKRILYNLLFIPNSRFDDFLSWKYDQIRAGAYHVIKAYEDPEYNPIALCQINYKWRFNDKTENPQQRFDLAVYHEMARNLAISYGILEQDSYHRMYDDDRNRSLENILFLYWQELFCVGSDGEPARIEGNPIVRSARSNMSRPYSVWDVQELNITSLPKTEYEKTYSRVNREIKKDPMFKERYDLLTKVFVDYLKEDYPDWEEYV